MPLAPRPVTASWLSGLERWNTEAPQGPGWMEWLGGVALSAGLIAAMLAQSVPAEVRLGWSAHIFGRM